MCRSLDLKTVIVRVTVGEGYCRLLNRTSCVFSAVFICYVTAWGCFASFCTSCKVLEVLKVLSAHLTVQLESNASGVTAESAGEAGSGI